MPRRDASEALASTVNVSGWLPLPDIPGSVPEGGTRAWFVVTGLTCCLFTSYGYINSWGVFQTYYEQNLHIGLTPTTISWIGAAQRTLFFLFSVLASRLFDMGYFKRIFAPASFALVLSIFLTGECERFWQFLVCQGVLGGMASGCLVANIAAISAQWFKKRYDLVLGVVYAGSAVGGVVFPVLAGVLLPRVEFKWSMRILSLVCGVGLLIASFAIQRRLPPVERRERGRFINQLRPLKSPAFSMYCLGLLFQVVGFYTFMTYVSSTAVTKGSISPQFGYFLIAVLNGTTGLGRVVANGVVRRFGAFNIIIPTLAISGAFLVGGWPVVDDKVGLVVLTVAYALCAAPHNALASRTISVFSTSDSGDVSLRIGLFNVFAAVAGLVGPPTAGEVYMEGGMRALGGYAGEFFFLGVPVPVPVPVH
ncbi:MFS general substrate transporter [Marasmius fiardii PR-910]|nr:MFS general substrate transporter [Marasmius fiardii PR-910]